MKCHDKENLAKNTSGMTILSQLLDESMFCDQHHANDILCWINCIDDISERDLSQLDHL